MLGHVEPVAEARQDLDQPAERGQEDPAGLATDPELEPGCPRLGLAAGVIEGEVIHRDTIPRIDEGRVGLDGPGSRPAIMPRLSGQSGAIA